MPEDTAAPCHTHYCQHCRRPAILIMSCVHAFPHHTQDNKGLTPLHWAVLCNQPAHTHLLLTSTAADISIQDLEGRTALTHAVLNTSSSCIKVSTSLSSISTHFTPHLLLICVCVCVVQVILEVSEGMVNQCDDKGRTALHYACAEGSTDCVRTLLTVRRYLNV